MLTVFPNLWGKVNLRFNLSTGSDKLLHRGTQRNGFIGDVLIGAALGPVFSSCSPTYAIIIATILPQDAAVGVLNLIVYILGLALILSLVAIFGQSIVKKTKWATNPDGKLKKFLGILFIVIGLSIFTGFDKKFETFLLDRGLFDPTQIEFQLLDNNTSDF